MKPVNLILTLIFVSLMYSCGLQKKTTSISINDLVFNKLATGWDEGIPLGNGMLGR